MLRYKEENWADVVEEMKPLFPDHWDEVAMNKDKIKLDVDYDMYAKINNEGKLFCLTVRTSGNKLVGYLWAILSYNLHYKTCLCALFDVYYLAPEYRKGFNGVDMISKAERCLKQKGVDKMCATTKLLHDASSIFKYLEWTPTEQMHTKYIGD